MAWFSGLRKEEGGQEERKAMTLLQGKGLWAYRRSELARAIEIAPDAGVTHILYKVGQGSTYYAGMDQVAQDIVSEGLTPFAWWWLLLDDPQAEARAVERAFRDGFHGFVFDTEADRCRNRSEQAARLGRNVRSAGLDLFRLYNCSYPTISQHRDLPYEEMNAFCRGGFMPMSYGSFFAPESAVSPEEQSRTVLDRWTYEHYAYWCSRWGDHLPLYPILAPYHDEHGSVRMPPDEFQLWLDRLAEHQPTFFSIFTTAVIEDELLPLIRAFQLRDVDRSAVVGVRVEAVCPVVGFLNVRPTPSSELPPVAQVVHRKVLQALEPESVVRAKLGQEGEWLQIRTPDGVEGYVAAWNLAHHREVMESDLRVEVVSPGLGFTNVRPSPSTRRAPTTRVDHGDVLSVLEPVEHVRAKVGKENQWLYIRTLEGIEGWVLAQYLRLYDEATDGPVTYVVVRGPTEVDIRPRATKDAPPLWKVGGGTVLEVREDQQMARGKVGKDGWLRIRTPSLREGYVHGLHLQVKELLDRRERVENAHLAHGECSWVFGIHAAAADTPADFRFLFHDKDKTGWVLFTEAIGSDPEHVRGHDYNTWADMGFGVIVRINHGYEPAGTLPVHSEYGGFARACAKAVQSSAGCFIWIIGNEQNNVREHPGGAEDPVEHLTPEKYAGAFNLVRGRIKEVQPHAVVVPGAVDPYNTVPWARLNDRRYRPLEYFKEMLGHIDDLDGIALHAYSHWMDASLITRPTVFRDELLQPGTPKEHYYDFQTYRSFAEAIPEKWRDRPIYITEANHWVTLERRPRDRKEEEKKAGWVNKNKGWIQAAYKEIDRWNSAPHAQQVHCLMLYRWTGDAWAMEDLGQLHKDFREALDHDYRWRQ